MLKIHDTVTRIKLMSGFKAPVEALEAGRAELQTELEANTVFRELADDRRKRLMSGEEMFVVGMRAVAIRIMGWHEKQFNGIYAYFSAHAHSAPVSFMRMADHEVDYLFPSEAKAESLGFPLEVATSCLRRVMLRMIDQHPEPASGYNAEMLSEARELDAACGSFEAKRVAGASAEDRSEGTRS